LFLAAAAGAQVTLNSLPSREIGHAILPKPDPFNVSTISPNLVEGRELFNPYSVAIDTSASPPILYVADGGNNRILGWKNASAFSNGKAADFVIGQIDFFSTNPNGPGISTFTAGLNFPTGLAVLNGDLYVSDSGNNRVLRFRAPSTAPAGQQQIPDLCLGQPSFASRSANAPTGLQSEKGLSTPGALRFDKAGNLWVADSNNNRVLRFDSADIAKPATPFNISARLEIGQLDFISKPVGLPVTDEGRKTVNQLNSPTAINFDSAGRLYIGDIDPNSGNSRVLVFVPQPQFTNGMSASRIMGIYPIQQPGQPPPTDLEIYTVQIGTATDIFFLPGTQGVGVLDAGFHRIMIFDAFDSWPDVTTSYSPKAKSIIGHLSGVSGINSRDQKSLARNDGNAQGALSSAGTFSSPQAAVFVNSELFVADTFNNRVIVLPFQGGALAPATRVLGQDRFDMNAPNLIEGREFDFVGSVNGQQLLDAGIAIDSTGDTPHLYVADAYNNRVLGFKDIRKLKAGRGFDNADIVIGQPDFNTAVCNYPTGDIQQPLQNNLCRPIGVLVDTAGNLYVTDSGNSRVLRFPAPFSHVGNQTADLVLGQSSFFVRLTDPSARTMGLPYGLAFAGNQGLLVSDEIYNRVLFIPFTNGGFTSADNGKAATKVFGQPDFTTVTRGTADTGMYSPKHIGSDTSARPYVIDAGNNRILIFDSTDKAQATSAHPAVVLPVNSNNITSVFVNSLTGEMWVGDLNNSRVLKYPKFDTLLFNPAQTPTLIQAAGPLALAQDQFGDLIVAERINRVTFYFPGLSSVNAANLAVNRPLAPNTWSTMYPASGGSFGKETADYSSLPNPLPIPKALADIQVLLDGTPCPMSYVSPTQINFLTPWGAATSGNSELQVIKISTGQVLAAGLVAMNNVSPGIFTGNRVSSTTAPAAVINQDGSINSSTHPAARGEIISIYATGQGFIPGAPNDGELASGPLSTPDMPRVFIGACWVDDCPKQPNEKIPDGGYVTFSGTAFPGLWQVNVQIPQATDPSLPAVVLLQLRSVASNGLTINGVNPVIYVKAAAQ
jgi:uncharacterized protein (TIGR03437 family)